MRAIARRGHSTGELATLLRRRGVSDAAARTVIDRLVRTGLLDDTAFAHAFCRLRVSGGGRNSSVLALRRDLARRGVARDVADAAIAAELSDAGVSERDLAMRAGTRKWKQLGRVAPDVARARLVRFLRQRGFGGDAVRHAVSAITARGSPS